MGGEAQVDHTQTGQSSEAGASWQPSSRVYGRVDQSGQSPLFTPGQKGTKGDTKMKIELIRAVVGYANSVGQVLDVQVEITEEHPDYVKVRATCEEGETDTTATIRVLGDFEYEDCDTDDQGNRINVRKVDNTLLGVWIDGESGKRRWRIIDARGTSLFAMLYV